jgi:hypothetical protein
VPFQYNARHWGFNQNRSRPGDATFLAFWGHKKVRKSPKKSFSARDVILADAGECTIWQSPKAANSCHNWRKMIDLRQSPLE